MSTIPLVTDSEGVTIPILPNPLTIIRGSCHSYITGTLLNLLRDTALNCSTPRVDSGLRPVLMFISTEDDTSILTSRIAKQVTDEADMGSELLNDGAVIAKRVRDALEVNGFSINICRLHALSLGAIVDFVKHTIDTHEESDIVTHVFIDANECMNATNYKEWLVSFRTLRKFAYLNNINIVLGHRTVRSRVIDSSFRFTIADSEVDAALEIFRSGDTLTVRCSKHRGVIYAPSSTLKIKPNDTLIGVVAEPKLVK